MIGLTPETILSKESYSDSTETISKQTGFSTENDENDSQASNVLSRTSVRVDAVYHTDTKGDSMLRKVVPSRGMRSYRCESVSAVRERYLQQLNISVDPATARQKLIVDMLNMEE